MKLRLYQALQKRNRTLCFLLLFLLLLVPLIRIPSHTDEGSQTNIVDLEPSFDNFQVSLNSDGFSIKTWLSTQIQFFDNPLADSSSLMLLLLLQSGGQSVESDSNSLAIANRKVISESDARAEKIDKLRGKTLDIYSLLIGEDRPFGIREIQRYFDYSSPNLATYHLDKLYHLDLVIKTDDNRYKINPDSAPIGEYEDKIHIFGRWVDPNLLEMLFINFITMLSLMMALFEVSGSFWSNFFVPLLILYSLYQVKRQYKM